MSHADESHPLGPVFEQPEGVAHFAEEPTVPLGGVPATPPHGSTAADELTLPLDDPSSASAVGSAASESAASEDVTLPLVDLYPTAENWNTAEPHPSTGPYFTADPYPGGQATPAAYHLGPETLQQPPRWPQQAAPHPYHPGLYGEQPVPYMHPVNPYLYQSGPYAMAPQEHPQATAVLVLGVISFVFPILSFIAWFMGATAKREIERGAPYAYTGSLKTGHIIGKVVGIITMAGVGAYIAFIIIYVVFLLSLFG